MAASKALNVRRQGALQCTIKETQRSLTNRARRLKVSQGHQTWDHSLC